LDKLGIEGEESKFTGKIEYPVAEFDNYLLAKCYWRSRILDWSMLVWRCHRRKPIWTLTGFAQRMLCSQYHTVMQKWNKYSTR